MVKKKKKFSDLSILVVGDVMLDIYLHGDAERISPEAPVPVVDIFKKEYGAGGAGNVAINLTNLGVKTSLIGVIGKDANAGILSHELLQQDVRFKSIESSVFTTTKTRVVANKQQQIVRIDEEMKVKLSAEDFGYAFVALNIDKPDLIIISDYAKGVCSEGVCSYIIKYAKECKIPVIVDPKGSDWKKYNGAYLVAPNIKELEQISGLNNIINADFFVAELGKRIYDKYDMKYLLITRSEKGMTLINKNVEHHVPSAVKDVFDVSGAGDTVVAVVGACIAKKYSIKTTVDLAVKAAEIVIGHKGTIPIKYEELF